MSRKKSKSKVTQGNLFDLQVREPRWDALPTQVKAEAIRLVQRMLNECVHKGQQSDGGSNHE